MHMIKHNHPKRHKGRKALFLVAFFVLLGVFAFQYFNEPSVSKVDGASVVAVSTPVVRKPVPRDHPFISITPLETRPGEPALITVEGLTSTTSVKSFTFDNRPLIIFLYEGQVSALLGVDLRAIPGTFPLVLTLRDGQQIKENFIISERVVVQKPFDIPDKLGGNTPVSEKALITSLAQEGKIINAIFTSNQRFWTDKFGLPLKGPLVVSDPYWYTRLLGKSTTMPHKGTDFQASIGTPVYVMNRGVVGFVGNLRNYGKVVVIDHGVGLQTVYMHLSEINVVNGQIVEKGEQIALSGDTGYVLGPHLHVTVRIWDISIDPMKFLELLGDGNY